MRILYTLNSGTPGGMEQHVLDLVKGMIENGHEVYVWCKEGPIFNLYENTGAKVYKEKIFTDFDLLYIAKLVLFLRKNKINIIHCHELKAVVNSLIASSIAGTKVKISHIHTPLSEWRIPAWKKRLYSFFYSLLISWLSTKEIALTESRARVKKSEGIPENKLITIFNGINVKSFDISGFDRAQLKQAVLSKYKLPDNAFIIGYTSRVSKEKGHEILIKAFKEFTKLPNVSPNVYLILAGGGILEKNLKCAVKNLNIEDRVIITGIFPAQEHKRYFASYDIFVFPTLAEGFGIVLLEAMAAKLPVLCSNLEVLQEVAGPCAVYFQAGDYSDLVFKLNDIYLKRNNLDNLKECEYKRVNDLFSIQRFIENYEKLYSDLLSINK